MTDSERDEQTASPTTSDVSTNGAATVGERLTGERDSRDPDGLLTVDQIAGGSHGASPEEGLRIPRGDRIEEPTDSDEV